MVQMGPKMPKAEGDDDEVPQFIWVIQTSSLTLQSLSIMSSCHHVQFNTNTISTFVTILMYNTYVPYNPPLSTHPPYDPLSSPSLSPSTLSLQTVKPTNFIVVTMCMTCDTPTPPCPCPSNKSPIPCMSMPMVCSIQLRR